MVWHAFKYIQSFGGDTTEDYKENTFLKNRSRQQSLKNEGLIVIGSEVY